MKIDCTVPRASHEETTVALVTAEVDDDFGAGKDELLPDLLFKAIRKAVTDWSRETAAGARAIAGSSYDYNIGDLVDDLEDDGLRIRLHRQGIRSLEITCQADDSGPGWEYDDHLFDDPTED